MKNYSQIFFKVQKNNNNDYDNDGLNAWHLRSGCMSMKAFWK